MKELMDNKQLLHKERPKHGKMVLERLGLELKDLKNKKVLDLGCFDSALEELAKDNSIDTVLSLDRQKEWMSGNEKLSGRINADAGNLPFADKSIDLVISNGGPPTLAENEETALGQLDEIERVLTDTGEARIALAILQFIFNEVYKKRLLDKIKSDDKYKNILVEKDKKELDKISLRDIISKTEGIITQKERKDIYLESIVRSNSYLKEKGYNIKIKRCYPTKREKQEAGNFFWILKKRGR